MPLTRTEKMSHYAVVVIAISAVVVSVWQVQLAQTHNRFSVRPYMDFFSGWVDEDEWQVTLSNEGVGPAILQSTEFTYKGKTYYKWDDLLDVTNLRKYNRGTVTFSPESPFAVGKTIVFFKLLRKEDSLRNQLGIDVKVKYESIYEEHFELKMSF